MTRQKNKYVLAICGVLLLALIVRLIKLEEIPAGLFGDIIHHLELARDFQLVRWGGDGELFPLLAAVVGRIWGFSFNTLKLLTVVISVCGVLATMLYATALSEKKLVGIFAGLFMALSLWDINMSHAAKSYTFLPLFAALIPYLILKKKHISAGLAAGISLYSQAAIWGVFAFSVFNPLTFVAATIAGLPFFKDMIQNPGSFFSSSSHIGEKLALSKMSQSGLYDYIFLVLKNFYLNTRALFTHGDSGFRGPIPATSHLDIITALIMLAGIIAIFYKIKPSKIKKYVLFFILPFVLVQLPAALDAYNPLSTPNIGRTAGMVVYASFAAGYGLYAIITFIKKRVSHNALVLYGVCAIIFGVVGYINLHTYWFLHPTYLPNKNVPFAETIAKDADSISKNIPVYVYGSGWGQWGQPEPGAFQFLPRSETLYPPLSLTDLCPRISMHTSNVIVYTDPVSAMFPQLISNCRWRINNEEVIMIKGELVAKKFSIAPLPQ